MYIGTRLIRHLSRLKVYSCMLSYELQLVFPFIVELFMYEYHV